MFKVRFSAMDHFTLSCPSECACLRAFINGEHRSKACAEIVGMEVGMEVGFWAEEVDEGMLEGLSSFVTGAEFMIGQGHFRLAWRLESDRGHRKTDLDHPRPHSTANLL